MEQTAEQRDWQKRYWKGEARVNALHREMMQAIADGLELWRDCPFAGCRRASRCRSRRFSQRNVTSQAHISRSVRQLSETIMPACAAALWYEGLQEVVTDWLNEARQDASHPFSALTGDDGR